eukprot:237674-Chlamydomonas_euryale.AAC.3
MCFQEVWQNVLAVYMLRAHRHLQDTQEHYHTLRTPSHTQNTITHSQHCQILTALSNFQSTVTHSEHCHTLRALPNTQNTITDSQHCHASRAPSHAQSTATHSEHRHIFTALSHTAESSQCGVAADDHSGNSTPARAVAAKARTAKCAALHAQLHTLPHVRPGKHVHMRACVKACAHTSTTAPPTHTTDVHEHMHA